MQISESQRKSIEALLARDIFLFNIMHSAWSRQYPSQQLTGDGIRAVVREYQRFLTLKILYPERVIRPSRTADRAWHAHVLATRSYQEDCELIFGAYLHHDPGVTDDSTDAETAELYRSIFTRSAWGQHDPLFEPLMLDPVQPASSADYGGETCA